MPVVAPEKAAGLVPLDLTREQGTVVAARLAAPQKLALGDELADLAGLGGLVALEGAQVGLHAAGRRERLADEVVDDLIVYRLAENEYMVVANASNAQVVLDALTGALTEAAGRALAGGRQSAPCWPCCAARRRTGGCPAA